MPGTRLPDTLQADGYSHYSPPQHHARRHLTPLFCPLPSECHRPRRGRLAPTLNRCALSPRRMHLQRHGSPYTALCSPYPSASTRVSLRAAMRPLVASISVCAGRGLILHPPGTRCAVGRHRSPRASRFLFPGKIRKSYVRRAQGTPRRDRAARRPVRRAPRTRSSFYAEKLP